MQQHLSAFDGSIDGVSLVRADTSDRVGVLTVKVAVDLDILTGADVMVVTPTNGGAAGTTSLNARLHDMRRQRNELDEVRDVLGERFSVGDPILFRRNDYRRALFNGSLGTVVGIESAARTVVARFDEEHALAPADMVDVSVGYALTCHRAQGSQAKRVVIALPRSRLLDPSWLYTAVTRAEQQVVLVGTEETIRAALAAPWASDRRMVGLVW